MLNHGMDKRLKKFNIDNICNSVLDKDEIIDKLKDFWIQLSEKREKKYFINHVFIRLGYFPEVIYLIDCFIVKCADNPEDSYAQDILEPSKRKNKEIK